jgi:hypothetical protein
MGKFKKLAYNRNEGTNWQMVGQHAGVAAGAGALAGALGGLFAPVTAPIGAATGAGISAAIDLGGALLYKVKDNKKKLSQLGNDIQDNLMNLYKTLPENLKNKYGPDLLYWMQNYKPYIDNNIMNASDEDNVESGVTKDNYKNKLEAKTKWYTLFRWAINQQAPKIVMANPDNPRGAFLNWVNSNMASYEKQPEFAGISSWIMQNFDTINQTQKKSSVIESNMRLASELDGKGLYELADIIDKNIRLAISNVNYNVGATIHDINLQTLKEFFDELGINPTFDRKELSLAYRRALKYLHPDRNLGADETIFKEVSHIYDQLKKASDESLESKINNLLKAQQSTAGETAKATAKKAAEEAAKKAAQEAEAKKAAEQYAAQETAKKAAQEAARKSAQEEAARKAAQETAEEVAEEVGRTTEQAGYRSFFEQAYGNVGAQAVGKETAKTAEQIAQKEYLEKIFKGLLEKGKLTPEVLKFYGKILGIDLVAAAADVVVNAGVDELRVRAKGGNAPYASNEVKDTMHGVEQVMKDMLLKPEKAYVLNFMNNRIRLLLNNIQMEFGTKLDKYNQKIAPSQIELDSSKYV